MFRGLNPVDLIYLIPVLLISLTVHEFAHGFIAYALGDNTPKISRRLTLNPIQHIDPMGFLMLILVGFGWAKPVPVNVRNFKDPKKDMAFCALAGPAANILTAFLTLVIWNIVVKVNMEAVVAASNTFVFSYAYNFRSFMVQYNCMLALFNLIPISPLDGSKLLYSVLPDRAYFTILQYERYGMLLLMLLLFTGVLSPVLYRGISNLVQMLVNAANYIVPVF